MQTPEQALEELNTIWYPARRRAGEGKSFTFATENGSRTLTEQDLSEIKKTINLLERRASTPSGQRHNVAVANFNHDG